MNSDEKITFVQTFLLALVAVSMLLVFIYFLTHEAAPLGTPPAIQEHSTSTPRVSDEEESRPFDNKSGGVGMTFGGKMGIEIAPNLIMPFSGGGLQMGFGF